MLMNCILIIGLHLCLLEPPQFTVKPPATMEVTEGEKVTLDCAANGKPAVDIKWNSVGSTLVLSSGVKTNSLIFTSINKTDNGEFICTASNVAGKVTQSVKVTVNCKFTSIYSAFLNLLVESIKRPSVLPECQSKHQKLSSPMH